MFVTMTTSRHETSSTVVCGWLSLSLVFSGSLPLHHIVSQIETNESIDTPFTM